MNVRENDHGGNLCKKYLKVLKKQEKCLIKRGYKMTEENKVLEFEESITVQILRM
jgi:hypothetical protein